jgi:NO-binding membrane sensor protein with MHYT domain
MNINAFYPCSCIAYATDRVLEVASPALSCYLRTKLKTLKLCFRIGRIIEALCRMTLRRGRRGRDLSFLGISLLDLLCYHTSSAMLEHGRRWSSSIEEPRGEVSTTGTFNFFGLTLARLMGLGRYLLFGSSISMGGIAIWCMHYISNRAIVLGDGQAAMQISYSSEFTALSFFVPILVLLAAFTAVGSDDQASNVRVAIGGTLAGLAICGMHYLGQAGISNYTCIYSVGNVVGSAVVAAAASVVALSVFFILRASWTNSWWKRAFCALILAGAVFGMHWLASVGTQYRLKPGGPSLSHNISRDSTVIVVIVLVRPLHMPQPVLILRQIVCCCLLYPYSPHDTCTEEESSFRRQSTAHCPSFGYL